MKAYLVKELVRLSKVAEDSKEMEIKILLDAIRASIIAEQSAELARKVMIIVATELMPKLKTEIENKDNIKDISLN
jgi:hypothetical protein